jgi:6-phosphogluconolactonase
MAGRSVVVRLRGVDEVADRVAAETLGLLRRAQDERREPAVVLTGGSISRAVHAAMAASDRRPDWSRVDIWWGDERYVASDDEERNSGQAWRDLLSRVGPDPARVHAMPAADDGFLDVEAAAWDHGQALEQAMATRTSAEPWFEVLMLGIGPDGHCASLFPGRAEVRSQAVVLGVRDSPKPPPERITMGLPTLNRARHVLFVATGSEKAQAVARSVAGENVLATPAAGPRGLETTTWYVDDAAAAALPAPPG